MEERHTERKRRKETKGRRKKAENIEVNKGKTMGRNDRTGKSQETGKKCKK